MYVGDKPDVYDEPDATKVICTKDTKIPLAATFTIHKEDHTMGNLLRMQLLQDPSVIFAGYQFPHPLETHIVVKVQTSESSHPWGAMNDAVRDLTKETEIMQNSFDKALKARRGQYEDHGRD